VPATLNRAEGDGIDHQPRLEARLDGEQPTQLPQHEPSLESLSTQRFEGGFEPSKPEEIG
jgi:hypothetical protein